MSKPLISVVMSVHNDAPFLEDSIDSLLQQTFHDFEIVVVNDGSTDGSAAILQRLQTQDKRIRVINQENLGLTLALIHGCDVARAAFIARQDSDDWSHPERLEKQVAALQDNPRLVFVGCWAEGVTPEGRRLEVVQRPADPETATRELRFARQGPPAHGTVMFRRDAYQRVGGYRPQFYFSQDSDLWLRMAEIGPINYVPEVLYCYRRDANSLSSVRHDVQYEFGEIGQACHTVRKNGGDETELLTQAAELTRQVKSGRPACSAGAARVRATQYLIGS
ncbi:MAG: glycosyltransferase family 2 protein, partial [Planctomycetaceae bacterium]|nr:glycosyltransferase family 2 protein [Planctomycetaceae bacterium]